MIFIGWLNYIMTDINDIIITSFLQKGKTH